MEYNQPSEIVKDVSFGEIAKNKVIAGVEKLAKAVKSTLGASGKCVIYEDARGLPVITKDGVTVAESVVLFDPVESHFCQAPVNNTFFIPVLRKSCSILQM